MALKSNRVGVRTDQVDAYGRVISKSFFQSILDHLPRWTSLKVWKNGTEQLLPVNTDEPVTSPIVADIKYPTDSSATEQMFIYRESPTDADGEAYIQSIKGNTLIWNQFVNETLTREDHGITTTFANGIFTYSGTSTSSYAVLGYAGHVPDVIQTGHIYYMLCEHTTTDSGTVIQARIYDGTNWSTNFAPNTVIKVQTENAQYIQYRLRNITSAESYSGSFKAVCIDLTKMFGSTKAEEILAMETAQAGSGVAYFKSLFPLPYYQYDAGSLLSFNGTGIKTVGFNQWDEDWEVGGIKTADGTTTTSNAVRSKNFSPVLSNSQYYIKAPNIVYIFFYDGNYNYLGYTSGKDIIVSPLSGSNYFKIQIGTVYGTTYNHDVCINISDSSKNGTYESYTTSTTTIPTDTYFPDGMMGRGTAFDEFTNSRAIHRMKQTDLGSLNWTYQSGNSRFQSSSLSEIIKPSTRNFITTKYEYGSTTTTDQTIQIGANGYVYIKDSNYTDATTFKAAIDGLMLQYELAEEIIEPTLEFDEE